MAWLGQHNLICNRLHIQRQFQLTTTVCHMTKTTRPLTRLLILRTSDTYVYMYGYIWILPNAFTYLNTEQVQSIEKKHLIRPWHWSLQTAHWNCSILPCRTSFRNPHELFLCCNTWKAHAGLKSNPNAHVQKLFLNKNARDTTEG